MNTSLTPRSVNNRDRSATRLPATPGRGGYRYLTRDEIIAIYLAPGPKKNVAADYDVTPATVTHIKRGDRHLDITTPYRIAAKVNATLISMACGVVL